MASRAFTRSTGLPDFPFVKLGFVFAKWMTQRDVEGDEAVSSARETRLPLLFIRGLQDSLVGAEAGRILHEAAPRSELWLVPDADHVGAAHEERREYEAGGRVPAHVARLTGGRRMKDDGQRTMGKA